MATMNTVIAQVDQVKPNAYSDEDKANWINTLEGMVSLLVCKEENPTVYAIPEDMDKELRIPAPFEDVYALYVEAMIDFSNREYNNYNNAMLMFNERFDEYKKYYIRTNLPNSAKNFRNVMG